MRTLRLRDAAAHGRVAWGWVAALIGLAAAAMLVWMAVAWLLSVSD